MVIIRKQPLLILTLNIEPAVSFRMLVSSYKAAQCHNLEDSDPNFHCHENLNFDIHRLVHRDLKGSFVM
jgi:hypothetical protein